MKYIKLFDNVVIVKSLIILLVTFSDLAFCEDIQRIGLITPLSGAVAPHGRAVYDGLKMGLKDGGCSEKIQLFVEDDGFDPKRSVSASQKLINEDKVQALMAVGSGPTHAVAPISNQYKIPFLALAGDSSVASSYPFTVRLRPPAKYEGKLIAQLAKSERAKGVVILCSSNEFTLAICDTVSRELGDKVIFRTNILPEETDFKTIIAKIRVLNPSEIIPIFLPGKLGIFARQTKELQLNKPFLGGVFFESTSDLETSRGSLNGAKYVMPEVSAQFRQAYESLPTAAPGSIAWASIFFDTGRLICLAKFNEINILNYFKSIKGFLGSSGLINYHEEEGDRYLGYPFTEKIILDGKFITLSK